MPRRTLATHRSAARGVSAVVTARGVDTEDSPAKKWNAAKADLASFSARNTICTCTQYETRVSAYAAGATQRGTPDGMSSCRLETQTALRDRSARRRLTDSVLTSKNSSLPILPRH
jgi:hypothetical protein